MGYLGSDQAIAGAEVTRGPQLMLTSRPALVQNPTGASQFANMFYGKG